MSTPIPHAFTALFVLFLAVLAHVHSLHMNALNRPRSRESNPKDENYFYGEGNSYNHDDELRQRHRWSQLKDEVKEKFERYEDALSKEEKLLNTADVLSERDNLPTFQTKQETKFSAEKHSKSYPKHKSSYTQFDNLNSSNIFNVNSGSSATAETYQKDSVDAENVTVTDSFELVEDSISLHEENESLSVSNDSSVDHSSSNSKSNSSSLLDARCPTCRMRQDDRHYRIEHLKQQILSTLKIKNLPNATGVSIPKVPALAHLYEMDADMMSDSPHGKRNNGYGNHYHDVAEYDDDFIVKTERVFTAARQAPVGSHLNLTDTVYFSLPVVLYTSKVKTAYLWFYIRKQDVWRPYVTLTVERILPEAQPGNRIITKTVFSQKLLRDKAFGWKRIDMRDTLRRWTKHPMSNRGLQLRVEDDSGNNLIVLPPSLDVDKGYEPWLDTKIVEPRSNSRHRRSDALVCESNATESRCCRYPLYVAFAEFGWDWIIAPTHVKADYCSGECRMTMQDNTPHSWVYQQMPNNGGACCIPTKMSPLPLLYFDESMNILYQILQDMKVDKCGCA